MSQQLLDAICMSTIRREIVAEEIAAQDASVMKVGSGHMPAFAKQLDLVRRTLQSQQSLLRLEQARRHVVIAAWNETLRPLRCRSHLESLH